MSGTTTQPALTATSTSAAQAASSSSAMPALLHAAGDFFATPDGQAVYLAGVHTWTNGQTIGSTPFDFTAYLNLLSSEHANFIRLWTWGNVTSGGTNIVSPFPYVQLSNGKYDLTQFNQGYFNNLQSEVQQAGANGDYVSVMLFNGWSVHSHNPGDDPWLTNPFNVNNNVNGINGDPNNTGVGDYSFTLADPKILAAQEAYVAKVIQTVGNDPNVLFEVANEAPDTSSAAVAWQNTIVNFVHSYEANNGYLSQPVGITASWSEEGLSEAQINAAVHASAADWISPDEDGYWGTSTPATGDKPVIVDTDHVYGIGGDAGWVWKQFTDGNSVLSMDDLSGTGISGVLPGVAISGDQIAAETSDRLGITETREVASLVNLTGMTPSGALSSTGWALANPSAGEYVVYAPNGGTFTVNLSGSAGRTLGVQWMNIGSGQLSGSTPIQGGSSQQTFISPSGAAALVLTPQTSSTVSIPPPTPTATPAPTPTPVVTQGGTFGSGADTLTVDLAEDAYQGDAQASVSIDGTLLTATPITVTALHSAGNSEAFTFKGNFGTGQHTVAVSFLNDAWGGTASTDRNLYVDSITLDGQASSTLASGPVELQTASTNTFTASGGTNPPATPTPTPTPVGQDALTLYVSEDAWQGDAQFTIQVDGKTIGSPQTAFASHSLGQTQAYAVQGNFGAGPHQVGVTFLNDAYGGTPTTDRNLYLDGVDFDGKSFLNGTVAQLWNGSTPSVQVNAAAAGYGPQPPIQSLQPTIRIPLS